MMTAFIILNVYGKLHKRSAIWMAWRKAPSLLLTSCNS